MIVELIAFEVKYRLSKVGMVLRKCKVLIQYRLMYLITLIAVFKFVSYKIYNKDHMKPVSKTTDSIPKEVCAFTDESGELGLTPNTVYEPCEHMFVYDDVFINLRNIILIPEYSSFIYSTEILHIEQRRLSYKEAYVYSFKLVLQCDQNFDDDYLEFSPIPGNIKKWIQSRFISNQPLIYSKKVQKPTIALYRNEITNLYFAVKDLYNVFLVVNFFQQFPDCETNIVFVEKTVYGEYDRIWETLFGKIQRIASFESPVLYENLIWIMPNTGPMCDKRVKNMPLVESFRSFVLKRHEIQIDYKKNCNKLNTVLIVNKNNVQQYKQSNITKRNIRNDDELFDAINRLFPKLKVKVIEFDNFSIKQQLSYISRTDILIGMHETGMTHVLFLPKNSGVIELFPKDIQTINNKYKTLARSRGLVYYSWQNVQEWNDFPYDGSTYIPVNVIVTLLRQIVKKICQR
ncbi:protein O-GlcNAc transferase [Mytilus galloprovincialis]|uniref:EGF domain-specific O-linked N-acetylglucosamine transferase n=1 Tax=Mytilus galloprovincialis TaxID=29158 RepID=A0A8B6D6N9_MYTGA|nr:protein O-GlcNAc transferase [Mytilus galloprovincialis]